jgi:hypothetical protein
MPFNGKPCKYCKKGIINPSKYQTVCLVCKIKRKKETMKKLRKKWETMKKRRMKHGKKTRSK